MSVRHDRPISPFMKAGKQPVCFKQCIQNVKLRRDYPAALDLRG